MKKEFAMWLVNKMNLACELFNVDMYALVVLTIIACVYALAILPEIKEENLLRLKNRLKKILINCAKVVLFIAESIWNCFFIPIIKVFKSSITEENTEELEAFFQKCMDENMDENDAFLELGRRGYTLEDLKNTKYYNYAKEFSKTHAW